MPLIIKSYNLGQVYPEPVYALLQTSAIKLSDSH